MIDAAVSRAMIMGVRHYQRGNVRKSAKVSILQQCEGFMAKRLRAARKSRPAM
jgi:hypothetical protein